MLRVAQEAGVHGSEFKPWVLYRDYTRMEPFFPHWDRFIPIHSPEGQLFFNSVDAIRDPARLTAYREIPNEIWAMVAATYPATSSTQPQQPHLQQPQPQQPQLQQPQLQQPQPQRLEVEEEEDEDERAGEEPGDGEEERSGTKVRFHLERHTFGPDRLYFNDTRGRVVYTTSADWRKVGHKHYRYRNDRRYWCSKRPQA
ncbi:hypothetical protein ACHAPT_006466 [Fusarium lateritium]